ncbi:hypothetical protein H5410_014686 [Solanum commersonii]|uniref:Uncharacterized protein n=1 Tax=Solanum commersonii TaxID=4109 RepID=A0A9J5ZRM7_SOLCO|nr:hypothetical protein H5410_014686 [Solanum commersonii]
MPTPLSQNPRHKIKSSKWATHQTWYVGIWQVTSTNERQYQPRPTHIRRCICASGKRRRPMSCNINQGIHASVVVCDDRMGDIGCGFRASARRHRSWPARIGQRHATSSKACKHQPWHVRIG